MKKCPYCAEEVQDEAIFCRFCNHTLNSFEEQKSPINRIRAIIVFIERIFLNSKGRLNRKTFWSAIFALSIILFNIDYLSFPFVNNILNKASLPDTIQPIYIWLSLLVWLFVLSSIVVSFFILSIKRCHDFNKSWSWLIISIFSGIAIWMIMPVTGINSCYFFQEIQFVEDWGAFLRLIPFVCFCGFIKGTDGPNKYGLPDETYSKMESNPQSTPQIGQKRLVLTASILIVICIVLIFGLSLRYVTIPEEKIVSNPLITKTPLISQVFQTLQPQNTDTPKPPEATQTKELTIQALQPGVDLFFPRVIKTPTISPSGDKYFYLYKTETSTIPHIPPGDIIFSDDFSSNNDTGFIFRNTGDTRNADLFIEHEVLNLKLRDGDPYFGDLISFGINLDEPHENIQYSFDIRVGNRREHKNPDESHLDIPVEYGFYIGSIDEKKYIGFTFVEWKGKIRFTRMQPLKSCGIICPCVEYEDIRGSIIKMNDARGHAGCSGEGITISEKESKFYDRLGENFMNVKVQKRSGVYTVTLGDYVIFDNVYFPDSREFGFLAFNYGLDPLIQIDNIEVTLLSE